MQTNHQIIKSNQPQSRSKTCKTFEDFPFKIIRRLQALSNIDNKFPNSNYFSKIKINLTERKVNIK